MALKNRFADMITGNFIKFSITDICQAYSCEAFCHVSSRLSLHLSSILGEF